MAERILDSPQRFGRAQSKLIPLVAPPPVHVLDCGGTQATRQMLESMFPGSRIQTINLSENDLRGMSGTVVGDVCQLEKHFADGSFDLVFAGEVLEHLHDPNALVRGARTILRPGGYLLITTPNLASAANRLFLLFGLSLHNYHPSLKHRYGNPLLPSSGGDHKSVFTLHALRQMVEDEGLRIRGAVGFTGAKWGIPRGSPGGGVGLLLRELSSHLLPISLQEGIAVLAEKN